MLNKQQLTVAGLAAAVGFALAGPVAAEGSRYDLPRSYHSEISSAKAYLQMDADAAVLIDVRRLREYAAGHPYAMDAGWQHAFNVPFPHIVGSNDQDPQVLYDEVHRIVFDVMGGDYDTPLMTLCRTGFRSVLAGNILADPAAHGVVGQGFTNVRNIWEGFVGRYKQQYIGTLKKAGQSQLTGPGKRGVANTLVAEGLSLDLNNNDQLDVDTADVYLESRDANPDKDGWRNYEELPWSSDVLSTYAYLNDTTQYDDLNLTPVP